MMTFSPFQTRLAPAMSPFLFSMWFVIATTLPLSAAPGAHGPNGEHIDQAKTISADLNPRFEAFTETFEVVGELTTEQLILYIHDFRSNVPIAQANVEVELNGMASMATYESKQKHYVLAETNFIERLSQTGEHELVLTILTDTASDLLAATFVKPEISVAAMEEEHHHHFPWQWTLGLLLALAIGFLGGRVVGGGK